MCVCVCVCVCGKFARVCFFVKIKKSAHTSKKNNSPQKKIQKYRDQTTGLESKRRQKEKKEGKKRDLGRVSPQFSDALWKVIYNKTHNNSKHGAERIRAPRAHDSGRFVSILHLLFDPYRKRSTFASRVYVDERMRVLKICGVAWSLFFVRGNVETSRARLR